MCKFKRFFVISILGIFLCSNVLAERIRGEQQLIKSDSWVYESLNAVMIDSARTHFYDRTPLTVQEIKIMLNEIDYEKLSIPAKAHYDRIINYLNETNWSFGTDDFFLDAEVVVTAEGQYKSNDNLDWIFNRKLRSDFVHSDVGINVSKYAYLGADIILAQSKSAREANRNFVNVPYNMQTIDINFPHDAYLAAGFLLNENSGLNLKVATLNQNVGLTSMGSIILSDYLTDSPYAELKVFSPYINYAANVTMLGLNRYMYMHNLEVRPHRKITISVLEAALPYGGFDLRYFVPFSVFHGYAGWWEYQNAEWNVSGSDVSSYVGLKLNYTPVEHLRLYSNFALTQYQMPNENDKTIPNGGAMQLGIESYIPINEGFLHLRLEGASSSPYFYLNSSPNWSFVKTYSETCDNAKTFYEWIGFPYGPDTIGGKVDVGYEVPKKWGINLSYMFLARGELSNPNIFGNWGASHCSNPDRENWVYPTSTNKYKDGAKLITPSGIPEYLNVISIKGEYWPLNWLCVTAYPGISFAFNNNNKQGEFAFGFEIALSVKCFLNRIGK